MSQLSIALSDEIETCEDWVQLEQIISDRGSRYSVTVARVHNKDKLKQFLLRLKSNKKYAKATHNSYAGRMRKDSQLAEIKNDDGEAGAGMIILRMLRKANLVNCALVVTRWYGGVKLHGDRFKHVQDATRLGIDRVKSSSARG